MEDANQQVALSVTTSVPLTKEIVGDTLVAAIEGGISYWCDSIRPLRGKDYVRLKEPDMLAGCIDWVASIKATGIRLRDTEDGVWYSLSWRKLTKGFKVLAEKHPKSFWRIVNENADADDGDNIVQCALFGKIMFG